MTQVHLNGEEMSAKQAADLVIEEVEERSGGRWPMRHLLGVLDDWCDPDTRGVVHDAVWQKAMGERLN
jgi:hypothetical protein